MHRRRALARRGAATQLRQTASRTALAEEGAAANEVGAYIDGLGPGIRDLAREVHRIVADELPGAVAAIKWSQPVFTVDGKIVCYLRGAKAHVTVGYTEGRKLAYPDGKLEGSGSQMAHVKLRSAADLNEAQLRAWLCEAATLTELEGAARRRCDSRLAIQHRARGELCASPDVLRAPDVSAPDRSTPTQ